MLGYLEYKRADPQAGCLGHITDRRTGLAWNTSRADSSISSSSRAACQRRPDRGEGGTVGRRRIASDAYLRIAIALRDSRAAITS